jgi:hypothetical protein
MLGKCGKVNPIFVATLYSKKYIFVMARTEACFGKVLE